MYPSQKPPRDYQREIVRTALHHNTLVSLPTGLGKTLIAAVVMYNYYRWFPKGKVVFAAPTRPLVMQQAQACHELMGMPQSDTCELTGNSKKDDAGTRRPLWEQHRCFFVTPQSLVIDLKSGVADAHSLVCVVFDEAHRAQGNYHYCQAVAFLRNCVRALSPLRVSRCVSSRLCLRFCRAAIKASLCQIILTQDSPPNDHPQSPTTDRTSSTGCWRCRPPPGRSSRACSLSSLPWASPASSFAPRSTCGST